MTAFDDALAAFDARLARPVTDAGVPGTAWGVLRDGALVHVGGAGTTRDGEDRRPGGGSVFRIASMTKSFTAAMILLLRDEGRLRLDDPVGVHVPALASWRPPTADSPAITIRDLLTMSAGLPTDDPWGDRQQSLPLDEFERFLAAGPTFAWPPGAVFEYSNLGYGILGRVITAVAGAEYREVVGARLLGPLGMTATGYVEADVPEDRLVHGFVRRDDALVREGRDAYGALASMGGVYSSVGDLATWVAGFLDAFPARDDPEGLHPLRRASRREMQQVHRVWLPEIGAHAPDEAATVAVGGYGFGLMTSFDPDLGTFVGHAGGYPGFGSHMAWHPSSGLGAIGLGNVRYAPMRTAVMEALATLVREDLVPRRRVVAMPVVERAREAVEGLLASWDDVAADGLFAMNVDLDEPRERRRAAVAAAVERIGRPLHRDAARPATCSTPAELAWWLRGEHGWLHVLLNITPEPSPRVQTVILTPVDDPSDALRAIASRLLESAAKDAPSWPADLAPAEALDVERAVRSLHTAAARFGAMRLGLPVAGDGATTATWDLEAERGGRARLTLVLDPTTGGVTAVSLTAAVRVAPDEGW